MAEHTKTPWKVAGQDHKVRIDSKKQTVARANVVWSGAEGESIGYPEAEANAAFIVRCVNAHDDLVKALRTIVDGASADVSDTAIVIGSDAKAALAFARAALAKAAS
jgi:hypothetical protein